MDAKYNVSKKDSNGKWLNHGNVQKNKWGNLSLGMRCSEQLKAIVNNAKDGEWINFALFEKKDEEKKEEPPKPITLDDTIPF